MNSLLSVPSVFHLALHDKLLTPSVSNEYSIPRRQGDVSSGAGDACQTTATGLVYQLDSWHVWAKLADKHSAQIVPWADALGGPTHATTSAAHSPANATAQRGSVTVWAPRGPDARAA